MDFLSHQGSWIGGGHRDLGVSDGATMGTPHQLSDFLGPGRGGAGGIHAPHPADGQRQAWRSASKIDTVPIQRNCQTIAIPTNCNMDLTLARHSIAAAAAQREREGSIRDARNTAAPTSDLDRVVARTQINIEDV